jgi:LEA14-like dessication related protein
VRRNRRCYEKLQLVSIITFLICLTGITITFNIHKRNADNHFPNLQSMRYTIIVTIAFAFLLASCGKMKGPVFDKIENVKVGKLGLGASMITFDMQFFNPNNSRVRLKNAEGEAWLDSSYLGHFHVDTVVNILPNSNFTVPVKLDVDMKYFLSYSLFGFRNESVMVSVKGKAKAGKGGFYKEIPLTYEGRQNLAELFK